MLTLERGRQLLYLSSRSRLCELPPDEVREAVEAAYWPWPRYSMMRTGRVSPFFVCPDDKLPHG